MNNSLYLVTSEEYSNGKSTLDVARQAVEAGIDILQMREKDKSKEELIELGKKLNELCKKNNVRFIVNDDPVITVKVNADGVHVGQEDIIKMPIQKIRRIIGDKILGLSTHNIGQVKAANSLDIDYIAYGPVFKTQTKDYFLGTDDIKKVLETAEKPVVFIGGINKDNINVLVSKGANNIAVISAIVKADNIFETVKDLKQKIGGINEIKDKWK